MKTTIVSIWLLLLAACGSTPLPAQSPFESPLVSILPTSAPTELPPASAQLKPLPSVSPSPTPVFYQPFAEPVIDCQMYPVLTNCGQSRLSLGGRLAVFNSQTQQLTILDLSDKSGWQISQAVLTMDWSPSGDYLLVRDPKLEYTVYKYDGTIFGHWMSAGHDSVTQLTWAPGDTLNFDPFAVISANGAKAWIDATGQYSEQKRLNIQFASPHSKIIQWPLDISDKIHELIAWAPNTHAILANYFYAGNAVWVMGGFLYSIDALTGKIIDLHRTMLLDGAYEWHPTEPGLMVFSATGTPDIVGQRLTLLNVMTGKGHYLLNDNVGALTPTWSPDGKLIAFSQLIPPDFQRPDPAFSSPAIYIIDPATEKTHALTKPEKGVVDSAPRWSADGKYLLYIRNYQSQGYVEIRIAALDGSADEAVVTNLPVIHCFFNDYKCFSKGLAAYSPSR